MAYIYRYKLLKTSERNRINLQEYHEDLSNTINELFGANLKSVDIQEKYFEFRVYISIENSELRYMGKKLKRSFLQKSQINSGFIRMSQEFYVLVYRFNA